MLVWRIWYKEKIYDTKRYKALFLFGIISIFITIETV